MTFGHSSHNELIGVACPQTQQLELKGRMQSLSVFIRNADMLSLRYGLTFNSQRT